MFRVFLIHDFPLYINQVLWLSQIVWKASQDYFCTICPKKKASIIQGLFSTFHWKLLFFFFLSFTLVPWKIAPEWVKWLRRLTQGLPFALLVWSPHLPGLPTVTYHVLPLGSCWRRSQFQNLTRIPPSKNLQFCRFGVNQNEDVLRLSEHLSLGMHSYFSRSLITQAEAGTETTYLITSSISHFRVCVCVYVSIFTGLCSTKAALEPKLLPLIQRCSRFPLSLVWGHQKLQPHYSVPSACTRSTWVFRELIRNTDLLNPNQESWCGA